ncbi:LamG-like jellyroll fold domain-containing protein [Methanolobus sp. ZRKC5]|uniref:LamG-like jellyroll fold domain-containing protein n=1 Tax=unclassified Methanolobus TaxID=2629569 RepID=UPI00313A8FA6
MEWYYNKLFIIVVIGLLFISSTYVAAEDDAIIMFFGLAGASATAAPTSGSGLVAYYPFNGDTKDHSGNENDGTNNGAIFVTGKSGEALDFDGTNDYVYVPVNINQDAMPQVTMALWVKSDSDSRGTVISHDNGGFDRTIAIDARGGGLGWSAFSGSGGVLGYQAVTTNKWTFLAAVYDQDADIVELYVDGIRYEESGSLSSGWDYTHIGSNPSFGVNFDGSIDEVKIYNYALTQNEINSLFEGETTPTAGEITSTPPSGSGLVAHYPFDRNYEDSSIYQNHGNPKGSMDFTAGVVGTAAASFDGASYIEVSDSDSLDLTDDFTFSVWLNKIDAGIGGWAVVFSKGDTHSTSAINSPYALLHTSGKYPGVRVAGQIISSNTETNFNEWYFLTVTREESDLKFYINGELKDTMKSTASIQRSGSKLVIGIDPPGSTEYFKGSMDDLRIYNYALSQSEINSLYGGETVPSAEEITPPSTIGFSGLIFESRDKSSESSVQIPLTLNGIDENIGNMDITLGYDSSVLEATEVIKGGSTTNSLFDYNIVDGTIKISLADKVGFSGDGSIAYVRFDVIGAEGSSSPLVITKLSANRADDLSIINIPTQDGVFSVVSREQSLGDFDGDGIYTSVDALAALQMAVGKIPEDLIMDMNSDGQVSSMDARMILRIAAGLEEL